MYVELNVYNEYHIGLITGITMKSKKYILVKFGKHISELRQERNMSQEKLASNCNLHRTYIGMVERAERNISLLNIKKLADGLEVQIDELFRF